MQQIVKRLKKVLYCDIIKKNSNKEVSIVAEKKEKRYVSDNAQLMAEWDREKNADFTPSRLTLGSQKKYGGNALKDMNGKQR